MSNDFDPAWEHGHIYDGQPARVICVNAKGEYPVVALVTGTTGTCEYARFFKLSGDSYTSPFSRIINAPAPKRKFAGWLNFYRDGSIGDYLHETRDGAIASSGQRALRACVRVEFEERDGL